MDITISFRSVYVLTFIVLSFSKDSNSEHKLTNDFGKLNSSNTTSDDRVTKNLSNTSSLHLHQDGEMQNDQQYVAGTSTQRVNPLSYKNFKRVTRISSPTIGNSSLYVINHAAGLSIHRPLRLDSYPYHDRGNLHISQMDHLAPNDLATKSGNDLDELTTTRSSWKQSPNRDELRSWRRGQTHDFPPHQANKHRFPDHGPSFGSSRINAVDAKHNKGNFEHLSKSTNPGKAWALPARQNQNFLEHGPKHTFAAPSTTRPSLTRTNFEVPNVTSYATTNKIRESTTPSILSSTPFTDYRITSTTENHANNRKYQRKVQSLHVVLRVIVVKSSTAKVYDCITCPTDKTVIAKKDFKCSTFVMPVVTSCPHDDGRPGHPLRIYLRGKRLGRMQVLPEGSHNVTLLIKTPPNRVHTCSFKYHVKVNRCLPLPTLNGGKTECSHGRVWGSFCSFYCNPGFILQGSYSTECSGNDSHVDWSKSPPRCIAIGSCFKPDNVTKIRCSNKEHHNHFPEGTKCHSVCGVNSVANDKNLNAIHCVGGNWNGTLHADACDAMICQRPNDLLNGYVKCHKDGDEMVKEFYAGTVCQLMCETGYVVPKSHSTKVTMTCLGTEWNHQGKIECRKAIPPVPKGSMCTNTTLYTRNETTKLANAEFLNADGTRADVTCSLGDIVSLGVHINICTATDTELDTTADCKYSIDVRVAGCKIPPMIPHADIHCSKSLVSATYVVGSTCRYSCDDGYTIPTSQLDIAIVECLDSQQWNSSKVPVCLPLANPSLVQGSCDDVVHYANSVDEVHLPIPKFTTASGSEATVGCNVTRVKGFGEFVNLCQATDVELRTTASCHQNLVVQEMKCGALFPPVNGQMTCQMHNSNYQCQIQCLKGYVFPPEYDDLKNKHVSCDPITGQWDFQKTYKLETLPDCLGESTTSLYTDLHFNVSVIHACDSKKQVEDVQTSIRHGLVSRNAITCNRIDCTNFTHMCSRLHDNESIVETTWNVMATYNPILDDYSEEEPEQDAEALLTEIQEASRRVITSDNSFHEELFSTGATVIASSFWQGKIDLICPEYGYILNDDTFQCLQCPTGSFFENNKCTLCPANTYQDETGKNSCKNCPEKERQNSAVGARTKLQCSDGKSPDSKESTVLGDAEEVDYCDPNPCLNGATCMPLVDDALCVCDDYHDGILCETFVPRCPQGFCHNGGTCNIRGKDLVCTCTQGYSGTYCELAPVVPRNVRPHLRHNRVHRDPCQSSPCRNGGTCVANPTLTSYVCHCKLQHKGRHCESLVFTPCSEMYHNYYCLNGGRCMVMQEPYEVSLCLCPYNYMGSRCEYHYDPLTI